MSKLFYITQKELEDEKKLLVNDFEELKNKIVV